MLDLVTTTNTSLKGNDLTSGATKGRDSGAVGDKVKELIATFAKSDEYDGSQHAAFVIMCEAARLAAGPGGIFTMQEVWSVAQSLHENLFEESSDYDPHDGASLLPNKPIRTVVRNLKLVDPIKAPKSVMVVMGDVFELAEHRIIYDGMHFYDIGKRSGKVFVIEVHVDYNLPDASGRRRPRSIRWQRVDLDGAPIGYSHNTPSALSREMHGTVTNPYDLWRNEDNKTLRALIENFRKEHVRGYCSSCS